MDHEIEFASFPELLRFSRFGCFPRVPRFLKLPASERTNETISVGIHFTVHTKSAVAQMDVQTYFDKLPMSPDGLR